ncbi:MAG: M23 family metallopeptidase [Prevotellaceae bacterium]|jgi:murein DD-endopeptidase MepM/ murein hydrolase activator NlpD|nr:M23 family metallopeptidase [Prevotellaceae bacterium]
MARLRYKFNPETLLFEISRTSGRKKIMRIFRGFLVSVALAVGYYVLYTQYFETPKSLAIIRSNAEITVKYGLLNKRFQEANNYLTQIQRRDNNVYRATFGLDIIPSSVRDAGFGGVNRYADFEKSDYAGMLINTSRQLDILLKKAYIQSVSFDTIEKLAMRMEEMKNCIPIIAPTTIDNIMISISDVFRMRQQHPIYGDRRPHNGVDIRGPIGTPIFVTGDGKVTKVIHSSFSSEGYGNRVEVDHGFGYQTLYAHLRSINVVEGQMLKRGMQIGTLGKTGGATGPHVHYEVHYLDKVVNPLNYFDVTIEPDEYEKILQAAQRTNNEY